MTGKQAADGIQVHVFVLDSGDPGDVAGRDRERVHALRVALAVTMLRGFDELVQQTRRDAWDMAARATTRGNPRTPAEVLAELFEQALTQPLTEDDHSAMIFGAALAYEQRWMPDDEAFAEAEQLIEDALRMGPREPRQL